MLDEIRSKSAALKDQIKKLREEAASQIKPMLQQFMAEHPVFTQIKWTQYTPYFNDGDTCTFRVNEPYFFWADMDLDDEGKDAPYSEWGSESQKKYDNEWPDEATFNAAKKFYSDIESLKDELQECFGDHVEVIVKPTGVEVEEHDHD